jgi:hypothetical protein
MTSGAAGGRHIPYDNLALEPSHRIHGRDSSLFEIGVAEKGSAPKSTLRRVLADDYDVTP